MQKPPVTLDVAVALGELQEVKKAQEELKKTLEQLGERLTRVETSLGVSETGLSLIYSALEAAGIMKNGEPVQAKTEKEPRGEPWDPSKIVWVEATGGKGPYQKSQDVNNVEFKAMLKDLQSHKGKMVRSGYFFWVFSDGVIVGRKKRKQA